MPKASELKPGMIVDIDGAPHIVKSTESRSPSSRGASTLYKVRFNNLTTQRKLDKSFKGDDFLKDCDCLRCAVQFSYVDADEFVFMNVDDYSQYSLAREQLEEQVKFLTEGLDGIVALLVDGSVLTIQLPSTVALEIVETAPYTKGATATGRTKPARLSTGFEVQVPEYLTPGEVIKVNTTTGKFVSRA